MEMRTCGEEKLSFPVRSKCGHVEMWRSESEIQIAITELTRDLKCGDEDVWRKKTKLPSTEQVWTCGDVALRIRDTDSYHKTDKGSELRT